MKVYDFDIKIPRSGTGCVKWDEQYPDQRFAYEANGSSPAAPIPLWVADMDFAVAPAIQAAVLRRALHPVFGYTHVADDYYDAIISWFHRRHRWDIGREEILYTTGVVPAMSVAIKALTMPGEKVLILSPDYNCFFSSVRNNGCEVLECGLKGVVSDGALTFEVDWDSFESCCSDAKTTVFLLCNPHNPTGRVWTREELQRMNAICLRHGVRVVSDEIHCELVMPGHSFQPFASASEECRRNGVVLNSPSKSFNTAGLMTANIVCSHAETRRRLERAININEVCDLNPFGPVALVAAYNESEDWIDALNEYLHANYLSLRRFFAERLPLCRVTAMEGTYLSWVDVSAMLPMHTDSGATIDNVKQLCDHIMHQTNVWINPGTMYGPQTGEGFIRINIACPRETLMEALTRMAGAMA